jgi:hypothetical protein
MQHVRNKADATLESKTKPRNQETRAKGNNVPQLGHLIQYRLGNSLPEACGIKEAREEPMDGPWTLPLIWYVHDFLHSTIATED